MHADPFDNNGMDGVFVDEALYDVQQAVGVWDAAESRGPTAASINSWQQSGAGAGAPAHANGTGLPAAKSLPVVQ
jgi:hypothetical protein